MASLADGYFSSLFMVIDVSSEANPIMAKIFIQHGMAGVLGYKLVTIASIGFLSILYGINKKLLLFLFAVLGILHTAMAIMAFQLAMM